MQCIRILFHLRVFVFFQTLFEFFAFVESFVDKDLLNADDEDMLKDMIKLAYDGCKDLINQANEELASSFKINGMPGMF